MEMDQTRDVKRKAARWYFWLWFSPLLTIPTLFILSFLTYNLILVLLCPGGYRNCDSTRLSKYALFVAILVSALWHLILLIPVLDKRNEFVRWHGRQALCLAGVRTAIPLIFVSLFGEDMLAPVILFMIAFWLAGTLWGQFQARRGDCSLARWFGRTDLLPPPEPDEELLQGVETLLETIRSNPDKPQRDKAVDMLRQQDPQLVSLTFANSPSSSLNEMYVSKLMALVEVIRSNRDEQDRKKALSDLDNWGQSGSF